MTNDEAISIIRSKRFEADKSGAFLVSDACDLAIAALQSHDELVAACEGVQRDRSASVFTQTEAEERRDMWRRFDAALAKAREAP